MKINANDYYADADFKISERSTKPSFDLDKKTAKKELKKQRRKLAEFQERLFANDRRAVLVCFQGMDTSGKDSLIREVFKDFNVRGVEQHSFKTPTDLELSHNYLWRHYITLPAKGNFGIFNRTHYENVLVTRVHPEYLLNENLPDIHEVSDVNQDFWNMRFEQINNFEKQLVENGTIVFKFFLHLSKEEQKNRLLRRLNLPEKNWKFSSGDLKERALWDDYQRCYEAAIANTSHEHSPWYIVPADEKPIARLIVSSILNEKLDDYEDVNFPTLDKEELDKIETYKEVLSRD
ncbi:PPK2 family polyphosphate kinase [Nonlabens ponticola]|uniref:Polyphosphate kinase 2 family protein n=1 Tax=Nonlabens ponticola TaxID=2496866 RepID=A0A3S9N091_9FLAO|nr:PPK2 family polyphosphate kinase [Nonlabens ponticola]AZQ44742.1 polyphosphate kinase 2 family protein [Nonlabens ponticola]